MKYLITIASMFLSLLVTTATLATPTLTDVTGISGFEGVSDTGYSAVKLTDTAANTAISNLLIRESGNSNINKFGIYSFSVALDGTVTVLNTLDVFGSAGSIDPLAVNPFNSAASVKLKFNLADGKVTNLNTSDYAIIGTTFGFYLGVGSTTLYSHSSLNPFSADDMLLFDTSSPSPGILGSDVVLAFETDRPTDVVDSVANRDFDDLIIGISDVTPVPEPGSLALLGLGLIAVGFIRRRRNVTA